MSGEVERTVKDVAIEVPGATRVFESLGIDYCCGGGKSLKEACFGAGVSLEELLAALESGREGYAGQGDEDWRSVSLANLINHIVRKHHNYAKSEMERLDQLSAKVVSVHGKNHPELDRVRDIFVALRNDLIPHMLKEEQVLFPYIEQLEHAARTGRPAPVPFFGTVRNPVRMMMLEHDAAGDLLRELRTATQGYSTPSDGCISYRTLYEAFQELEQDLHQHIHLENNILFPKAVSLESTA